MEYISDLAKAIARCAKNEGINETCIAGLRLYLGKTDTPRQPVVYRPSICIVAQGQKQIFLGEHSYSYDPNTYLINSLTLPIEAMVVGLSPQQEYLGLSLDVDVGMISDIILHMDQYQDRKKAPNQSRIISTAPLTEQLQHNFSRLVALTTNPMDRDVLCESIKREIFYEVLKGSQGGVLLNCVRNYNGVNRLTAVVHFLEENFDQSLDIETITKVAQMSPSTLHEQFKAYTSLSPMQFVKNLRLHKARSLLLSGSQASHTSYLVGYSSPSQFSREFKRLFGCSPKDVYVPAD